MVHSAVKKWSHGVCLLSNGLSPSQCASELTQKVDYGSALIDKRSRCAHVVDETQPSGTGKEESTSPVSPSKSGNNSGQDETHGKEQGEVVLVLPFDDLVSAQVRNVGNANLASGLDDHPSDVRPPESLVSGVRVKLGVGVSVVSAVTP